VSTTFTMTLDQSRRLKELAEEQERTISFLLRKGVDRVLEEAGR